MPKRSPKIPYASGVGFNFWEALVNLEPDGSMKPYPGPAPNFTISPTDWKRIQLEYGHRLPTDVRKEILRVTRHFIEKDETERKAEPLGKSQRRIETYKKGLQGLQTDLMTAGKSDADAYARLRILQAARHLGGSERIFEHLIGLIAFFRESCDEALRQIKHDTPLDPSWDEWVRNLARISEDNDLPTKVRKDVGNKSKSDRQSNFTRFVQALQQCLPSECNLPYAESALPKRLWSALRPKKVSGPKSARMDPE